MSRRNKNKKQTAPVAQTTPRPTPSNESMDELLARTEQAAKPHATEAELREVSSASSPPPNASGEEFLRRAVALHESLEAQRRRLATAEADLTRRTGAVAEQEGKLLQQHSELAALQGELSAREKQLNADEADLLRRQEQILQREVDADAGFSQRNRMTLAQLETESETLRVDLSRHREKLAAERSAFEQDLQATRDRLIAEVETQRLQDAKDAEARRATVESELASQREELDREREVLVAEEKRVRKLSRDLDLDRELLQEDRQAFEEKVAQRAARDVELKNAEIHAFTERLETARAERDRIAQQLAEREEADRRFGGETPDEVLKRMQKLEQEREILRKMLGGRPSAEAAQRLEDLERQKELWESDRLKLLGELAEARQEAARKRIAVTELESLRDEKRALESANALLHEAHSQLRDEVDSLVKGVEGKSPFPSCSEMDTDNGLQSPRQTNDVIPCLADFAEDLRHRMAWDPKTKKELYYSAEDVRSFLGGLAMSQLHLLQGISGTGKTSLPLAFARAIGAGVAVIEVQAGWRDRQDLIGHFNTFERRFYESEFLQAIYRASTPHYLDTPFIIVLDEMNLSHPEQYFADLLSALEQDPQRRRLVLMTAGVDSAPQRLVDGGTKLPIPPNVWFVGTANHDETTKDFADKTYDRAHVMELPRHRETFKRKDYQPQKPVSLEAIETAFSEAVQTHRDDAARAYAFLQDGLGETLGRRFRVGWGNRLQRQLGSYVPVVVAAGGTVGEATDHMLATKLLRKIRDRHDNRPEDIIALRDHIQTEWKPLDNSTEPRRSLDLLKQELHRLGHDDA